MHFGMYGAIFSHPLLHENFATLALELSDRALSSS